MNFTATSQFKPAPLWAFVPPQDKPWLRKTPVTVPPPAPKRKPGQVAQSKWVH